MLGEKVRGLRKARKLTIAALAGRIGISESYLSQLESGRVDPSVSVIRKLAAALQVPISAFFDAEVSEPIVIRAGERKVTTNADGTVTVARLSPDPSEGILNMSEFVIRTGGTLLQPSGDYHTCVYVTGGTPSVRFAGTDALLSEGDSIYIPAGTDIVLFNDADQPVTGLLCAREAAKGDGE